MRFYQPGYVLGVNKIQKVISVLQFLLLCMYVYVCMYVCTNNMYIYIYVCMYACMYVHLIMSITINTKH